MYPTVRGVISDTSCSILRTKRIVTTIFSRPAAWGVATQGESPAYVTPLEGRLGWCGSALRRGVILTTRALARFFPKE